MNEIAPFLNGEYTAEERNFIKEKLFELTGAQTESYTMGLSTSVPVETARELVRSLAYSLKVFASERGEEPFFADDWAFILNEAQEMLKFRADSARRLYMKVRATAPKVATLAYTDTVASIGAGFKKYNHVFFAHEFPASIDYQLSVPVSEDVLGIEYISDYLSRLLIENRFVGRFHRDAVASAVNGVQDFYETYENIYETIATRALTKTLIGAKAGQLFLDGDEMRAVKERIMPLDGDEAVALLAKKADELSAALNIADEMERAYLGDTARAFAPRLLAALRA